MKIGPVDIRNHTFSRKMRGVDEHEVRDYLDLVADRLEEAILEGDELRARIDRLEHEVREHRALERSLRDSMLSAERLVDDRSAQAEKEAQIVIRNAEVQAGKILLQSREELGRMKAEMDDLRRQRVTYVERFRALLRSQGKILEASLETFDPDAEAEDHPRETAPPRSAPPEPASRESAPRETPLRESAPRESSPALGSVSSYVTRPPVGPGMPSAVPAPRPEAPGPPPVSPPPGSGAESGLRPASSWEPTGAARENFAPYAGQEGLFGGENG
jgi:cell division initiation protein